MYHFAWENLKEKQGYNSDVSLNKGIQLRSFTLGKYNFDLNLQLMPLFI